MVCACEDVGLAYPQIIPIVKAAVDAANMVGLPEARLPLADAVILVATSPKSNSAHDAINAAIADVQAGRTGPIPRQLQNKHFDGEDAAVKGQNYKYAHDYENHWVDQQYLPDLLKDVKYYTFGDNRAEQAARATGRRSRGKISSDPGLYPDTHPLQKKEERPCVIPNSASWYCRRWSSSATTLPPRRFSTWQSGNVPAELGTVYRNLNSLVDAGRVRRVSIPGKADRFDHTLLAQPPLLQLLRQSRGRRRGRKAGDEAGAQPEGRRAGLRRGAVRPVRGVRRQAGSVKISSCSPRPKRYTIKSFLYSISMSAAGGVTPEAEKDGFIGVHSI